MKPGLTIAIAAAASLLGMTACGGDEQEAPTVVVETTTTPADGAPVEQPPEQPAAEPDPTPSSGPAESAAFDPRETVGEREAARAVRDYVAALDARDGEAACDLLAAGAIDAVDLPRAGGDCASSLEASIGYRDPRGLPVWDSARVTDLVSVEVDGERAKVVATVVTSFADRDEASVEDDVVYLVRAGDGWLVAKASSTLLRAVGIADVPPSVLAPP
jgi:hypothetical protein